MRTRTPSTGGSPTTSTAVAATPAETQPTPPTSIEIGLENGRVAKHSSESVEHFTPPDVVEAARELMGGIDLDPASCHAANLYIRAKAYYSPQMCNGLRPSWTGRVFLNPPGGLLDAQLEPTKKHGSMSSAKVWWRKLVRHWQAGEVEQAVYIGFNLEIMQATQQYKPNYPFSSTTHPDLCPIDFPFCVPKDRLKFLYITDGQAGFKVGGGPTHANVIAYLPPRAMPMTGFDSPRWGTMEALRFKALFAQFGRVVIP